MKIVSLIIIVLLLGSCKLDHEMRLKNRKSKKIQRIALKYGLNQKDTTRSIVQYITEVTEHDTVFSHSVDTLTIREGNMTIEYIKTPEYVYLRGKCDSIIIRDTVITINDIIAPVEVERKLSGWDKFMMKMGNGVFWLFIAAIVFLIVRFVIKTYTGK